MNPIRVIKRVTRWTFSRLHRKHLSTVSSISPDTFPSGSSNPSRERPDPLFSYTSGRWLWDEATQLRKRYQPFNVNELKKTAARSVNAKSCTKIAKLPEGAYNKTFLLTMDNGVEIITKIPNPYLPQKFATASEVATLDFLRNELDIPVPRVFAWSSRKDQSVGVEYIIMERAPGHELNKLWSAMNVSDRVDIVSQLVGIQKKIAAVNFHSYGSLFYKDDIENGLHVPGLDRFCIGPSCEVRFWEGKRSSMTKYHGPWTSSVAYAQDIARREKEWIMRFAEPRHPSDPLRQSGSQESPGCHAELLDKYLEVIPRMIPSHKGLNRSVLWHPDLHSGNIFVDKNRIVSIIDWQGCLSLPIFHACRIPKFLKINGPLLFDLPPATDLTSQEKAENLRRYQLTQLQRFYISKFREIDNDIFSALSFPQALTRQQLLDFAGHTWDDDGLFLLREMIHRTSREWTELTGLPQSSCPVRPDTDAVACHIAEAKSWEDRQALFGTLGIPLDGWLHPDEFEAKVEAMRDLVNSIIASADDKEGAKQALRAWKLSDSGPASLSGNLMEI
ncbi:phosphotransferase enzyme family protein [Aspergillus ibericus CBS 121593]|uniref:Phosphotransferase enzyme family protein n=1 Tax=Aspergillus ibericus CBS 121593 TaxID=1448316 RepID=A0A395GN50_9EURO|nr:phosphotransferase enzyme family protein [Aspergillus ibericus CBS 121593]RAK96935.1 phosphotransferase enzyme family protein [Aspergillus ibericus CBS 121593]